MPRLYLTDGTNHWAVDCEGDLTYERLQNMFLSLKDVVMCKKCDEKKKSKDGTNGN